MKRKRIIGLAAVFGLAIVTSCSSSDPIDTSASTTASNEQEEVEEVVDDTPISVSEATMKSGEALYVKTCSACHQASGDGIPAAFPPLADSDYLNDDVDRAIETVLNGLTGEITVNGQTYNGVMAAQTLSDQEVADVLSYVYNSWGNNKTEVTADMVAAKR